MSSISSLSVWSSVKFPFPKYRQPDEITKLHSVESCDRFIKRNYEKSRAEMAPEIVNLKVPDNLNRKAENSVSNLYCKCARTKQNFPKCKKRNNHVRFVTVPEIFFYQDLPHFQDEPAKNFRCEYEETEAEGTKKRLDEIGSVPSVKPWTLEELVEINRQKQEAKKKKEAEKDRKERLRV